MAGKKSEQPMKPMNLYIKCVTKRSGFLLKRRRSLIQRYPKSFCQSIKIGERFSTGLCRKMYPVNSLTRLEFFPSKEKGKIPRGCLREKVDQKEPTEDFITYLQVCRPAACLPPLIPSHFMGKIPTIAQTSTGRSVILV